MSAGDRFLAPAPVLVPLADLEDRFWSARADAEVAQYAFMCALGHDEAPRAFTHATVVAMEAARIEMDTWQRGMHAHPDYVRPWG